MTISRVYSLPPISRRPSRQDTDAQQAKLMLVASLLCAVPSVFDLSREAAAIGLGALTLLPLIIISIRNRRLLIADPLVVVGLMWFLAVTLPVLVQLVDNSTYRYHVWYTISSWALDTAALWMYRGWAACCVAYWAARVLIRAPAAADPTRLREREYEGRLRLMIGGLGLVGSLAFILVTGGQSYSHIEGHSSVSSWGMLIEEARFFALLYVFLYYRAKNRGRLAHEERLLLVATMVVLALIVAASSSKASILQIAAAWVLGNAAGADRSRLLKEVAIGGSALVVIYTTFLVVTAYRLELRTRPLSPAASYGEVISQQLDAVAVAITAVIEGRMGGDERATYDAGDMLDRMALVTAFAMVLEHTNGYSPYEHAWETLAAPILAFLPRDLIGDKVQFMNSGTFAQLHGWDFGGLSLTTTGSLFWTWGFEGIILGMMLLGIIMAALASRSGSDGLTGLIYSALMLRLVVMMLDVGADFQPLIIGLLRSWMFLVVLRFLVLATAGGLRLNR